jgi:CubicO group peptidase (beta-lactamase class C family)
MLTGDGSFNRLFLHGGTNNPMDFGEIRMGTTWNVVLPPNHSLNCFPQHDFQAWPGFFASHLPTNSINGYTFLARYHGKTVANGSSGYFQSPSETNSAAIPWDTQRTMHIASVSKAITATAVMKLYEEKHGQFSLDALVWPYLKDLFPNASTSSKQITIRQLLTHRSGLTQDAADILSTARVLTSSNNKPGVRSYYNNLNFYILRLFIEKVSGEAYLQYVQNHVLKPAGALNMDTKSHEKAGLDASAFAGAIGWYASTSDLTAFLYGLSQGKIITQQSTEIMFHESFGWDPMMLDGQIIGYHKNGLWLSDDGNGETSEVAHFVDGVDVALLINSPTTSQTRLLSKAWQLDETGTFTLTNQPGY